MATVTAVKTSKPRVQSLTLELTGYEAADLMAYIESWYKFNGYGANQHKTNGLYKSIQGALDGKTL